MGRLSARWRRLWGIRPGELRRPVVIMGRRRTMGEPEPGPHGRGWKSRRERLRHAPIAPAKRPHAEPAGQSIEPAQQAVFPLELVADDELAGQVSEHAREMVLRVARFAPRPVLHARIVLRVQPDPALERPAIAKASLDVSGRPVRAHVAAEHMIEAIDLLERRLRRNLEDLEELARARRHETRMAPPGEWRHGSIPTARPEYFPRPPGERELIRRKTFALSPQTPEQAALEMQVLDYDFHLFTNPATGDEAVVYRQSDGTIALAQINPTPDRNPRTFVTDPAPAAVMLLEDAVERLNLSGERFLFFVDPQTRSGNVLYLRYDGHYGLIEPAATA
ncbi:MAG: ribosome hibernation promotion factor [Gaiellaceae bacterium]